MQRMTRIRKRDSSVAYRAHPRRTLQSAVAVAAILSGSSIGLLRRLVVLAVSTIIAVLAGNAGGTVFDRSLGVELGGVRE